MPSIKEKLTINHESKKIKFWLAKLFGKRISSIQRATKTEKGCKVTGYWYKDVLYLTNFSERSCLQ